MGRLLAGLRSTPVRVGFLVIALAFAIYAVVAEWDSIWSALASTDPGLLLGALVTGILYVSLTMLAWKALLHDMGTELTLGTASSVFFVSQVGKYLPGGVWNIIAAAEMGADHAIPRRRSVSVMVVSVVVSVVTGLGLAAGTMAFGPEELARSYGWTILSLPLFLAVLAPPVLNRVLSVALRITRRPPLEHAVSWRGIAVASAWTLAAWVVAGVQVWMLATGIGMEGTSASLALCIGGYALAWTVGFLVVFVPAGAGVREAVLGVMLAGSLTSGGVVLVVLLSRVVLTVADLLLGGLGLAWSRLQRHD